ncbi:MAG: heat-inducible transcription repressor HrcA [Chloroflexi bacterium]|nr:heat-inducible transcription repressor HrcA [Chloroflexota bacterium]
MPLSQRTADILKLIVSDYIESCAPVGSLALARHHGLRVSPATIRNDMVKLEDEGYIIRPHTSAGGIPADKGYRFYVETLPQAPSPDDSERTALEWALEQVRRDLEQWARTAASMMSEVVGTLAFASAPRPNTTRVKQLELLQIHDFTVLLVLILQGANVLRQLLPVEAPTSPDQIEHARNKLVRLFAGRTADEIAIEKRERLSPFEQAVIDAMVTMLREEEKSSTPDYVVEGLGPLFEKPELARPGPARELAEALDDDGTMTGIAADAPRDGTLAVFIGTENTRQNLREFSVIVSRYGSPEHASGIVGLIGPTRLAYHQALPVVGFTSSMLSEMVAEVYLGRPVREAESQS